MANSRKRERFMGIAPHFEISYCRHRRHRLSVTAVTVRLSRRLLVGLQRAHVEEQVTPR